jgi:hypothetical protein
MAKLTSKSSLIVGTNLTVNETARTITLIASADGSTTNGLIAKDGVTFQALYSKLVDLWATSTYQDSPFPLYAIDALSGQFQIGTDGSTFSGWTFATDATRQMLRDGGWSEFSGAGVLQRQYVGIVGLGGVSTGAQLYYQREAADAPTNFTFTDQCNEGIQVFGDASNGNFDKRSYFKGFVREYAKKYKDSVLADTGKTSTGANIVNLLLSNEDDLKILANDAAMSGAPYSGITVTYFGSDQNRLIGGVNYPFRVIINGNSATLEQIYTKVQYLLRQATDIDTGAGTVIGKTAAALLGFVGDTLETTTGVYIDSIQSADSNRIVFKDQTGVNRTNPYEASGSLNFNAVLVGAGSSYRLMYSAPSGAGNDYGESGAITVLDASDNPITGTISSGSIAFTFDYDSDTAGGTAGTDKAVTLIGVRPGSGKFAVATGTLTRSKSISLSLVAEQDRVYA